MNNKRFKTIGIVSIALAGVAVMSVGFSAWIIQGITSTTAQSISLTVADATDKSIDLKVISDSETDLDVVFDADKNDVAGDIIASSSLVDLDFQFTFTITVGSGTTVPAALGSITATFTPDAGLTSAVSANYVVSPLPASGSVLAFPSPMAAGTYYDGSTESKADFKEKYVVVATSTTVYTVTATYQFAWGSYFGNVNPSLCDSAMGTKYNGHTRDDILTALGTLKTNLNEKSIASLVLTPVAK